MPLPPSAVNVPQWIPVAFGEIGVTEDTRPGKSTARIEQYHAITRAGAASDDVPWCASFVGFCLEMAGVTSTKQKAAASYATWGDACEPSRFGCVLVFGKHDSDAAGTGHVGFCVGVVADTVHVLGGNQSNRVNIATRKLADVVTARWPKSVELPLAKVRP